jgi:hypothetical protein
MVDVELPAEAEDREMQRFARHKRTREWQQIQLFREKLAAHVGGSPSVVQSVLIEQAVQLKLRLAVMDRQFDDSGVMTRHDSRVYLAWNNSLERLTRRLGMRPVAEKPRKLADFLATRAGDAEPDAAA